MQGEYYIPPVVEEVLPASPAAEAGMQPGDLIVALDGQPVEDFAQVVRIIRANSGAAIDLLVARGAKDLHLMVKPIMQKLEPNTDKMLPYVGVRAAKPERRAGVFWGAPLAAGKTVLMVSKMNLQSIASLLSFNAAQEDVGGVIRIAQYSGETIRQGPGPFLWLMVLLSLNLAIINIMPLPVLDGGFLFFYLIEALRGKPMAAELQLKLLQYGLLIVVFLTLLSFYNDISMLISAPK